MIDIIYPWRMIKLHDYLMGRRGLSLLFFTLISTSTMAQQQLYLDTLDLSLAETGYGMTRSKRSVDGNPLAIGGQKFERGIGCHANSALRLKLDGKATQFSAMVGIDDEVEDGRASVIFKLVGDGKTLWESPVMDGGEKPLAVKQDLRGIEMLTLLVNDANDGNRYDHADWAEAKVSYEGAAPEITGNQIVLEMAASTLAFELRGEKLYQSYFGTRLARVQDSQEKGGFAYPTYWDENRGEHAISLVQADGKISLDLHYRSHIRKDLNENQTELVFTMMDPEYPVEVNLHYLVSKRENVVERWAVVRNLGEGDVVIHHAASGFLSLESDKFYLTSITGQQNGEAYIKEELLKNGIKEVRVVTGARTSQLAQPGFILAMDHPAEEERGEVIIGALAWSGNWRMRFESKGDTQLSAQFGYDPHMSRYRLSKGERLETPRLILSHSNQGKGEATRNLHRWALAYGVRDGDQPRRILLNSWEGAYFTFDDELIKRMITDAAKTGIELFVLDDGWFGRKYPRDHDRAGLGDWMVNTAKLKGGVQGLIDHSKKEGIDFGIWVEPEMVNPKSELYEKHPEWVITLPKRHQRLQRSQLILDLTNPAVQDYIFDFMDDLLGKHPGISYIKWDCNRTISDPGSNYLSADRQEHLWIDYVKGYYSVLDRITKKYPKVVFQACGSGGGRVDYGNMKYHHEYWVSDNTDARERVLMQWSISHLFPAIASAAHVTESPNHYTGRETSIKYRFDVAMMGRLGFELRPERVPEKDMEFSKKALEIYKDIRPVVQLGDLYRLRSPFKTKMASLMYVLEGEEAPTEALFFAFTTEKNLLDAHAPVKLAGLDPSARYKLTEINMVDANKPMTKMHGKEFGGDYLMSKGISLPWRTGDYQSVVIRLEELATK
ncbi:alpha-galactosidase [Verrucomicrobiaceae bacterium N1E253]|uniref:alpha-galactosidase n=1 Tax=Oceaniferula marina TaxID=2748318 RepID=A0A851GQP8_9BACT|nr:alpha-galactosidase [Oceaniferula marina]NWK57435.1 alpha-galactosidase [Oceaniferula marina]